MRHRTALLIVMLALLGGNAWAACDPSCTDLGGGACRCPAYPTCQGDGCDCDDPADATPTCRWRSVGRPMTVDLSIADSTTLGYCQAGGVSGGGTGPGYLDATRCDTSCVLGSACGTASPATLCGGSTCVPGSPGSARRALLNPAPRYPVAIKGADNGSPYDLVPLSGFTFSSQHSGMYFAGQTAPGDLPTLRRIGSEHNLGFNFRSVYDVLIRHLRILDYQANDGSYSNPANLFAIYHAGSCSLPNDNILFDHVTLLWADDDIIENTCTGDLTLSWSIIGEGVDGWQEFHRRSGTCGGYAVGTEDDCPLGDSDCCRGSIFSPVSSTAKSFKSTPQGPDAYMTLHHNMLVGARARNPDLVYNGAPFHVGIYSNIMARSSGFTEVYGSVKMLWWGNWYSQAGMYYTNGAAFRIGQSGAEIYAREWAYDGNTGNDVACGTLASPQNRLGACARCEAGAPCSYTDSTSSPTGTWPTVTWQPAGVAVPLVLDGAGAGGGTLAKRTTVEQRIVSEVRRGRCNGDITHTCTSDGDCTSYGGDCYLDAYPGEVGCGPNRRSTVEDSSVTDDEDGPCRPYSSTNEQCTGSGAASSGCAGNVDCPIDSSCVGAGSPWVCCTGAATGYCGDGDSAQESPGGIAEFFPQCCTGAKKGWCDWPRLTQGTPCTDSDGDAICDSWETARSLDVFVTSSSCPAKDGTALARIGTIGDNASPARTVNTDCNANGYDDLEDWLNELAGDGIHFAASATACGNGTVEGAETCDDGIETASCDSDCTAVSCGDSHTNTAAGEECDDGNGSNTDACVGSCVAARCGDGYVRSGVEQCDDGNLDDTDTCGNDCITNTCGNGSVDGGEACDPGSGGNIPTCDFDCTAVVCGDGVRNQPAGEGCDDGNTANGDGCSSTCLVEATCGNGIVESGEGCDDGNTTNGDDCDSTCHFECGAGTSVLTNGSFASDISSWHSFTDGSGSLSWSSGEALWTNTTAGTNVQVRQQDLALTGNTAYRLSFKCRASPALTSMHIAIIKHTSPFTSYVNEGVVLGECGTSMETHQFTFVTTPGDKTDARLMFQFGDFDTSGDSYYFDDVSLAPRVACVSCGNGVLDPATEECDDGNTTDGDGCSAVCTNESHTMIISEDKSKGGWCFSALIPIAAGLAAGLRR